MIVYNRRSCNYDRIMRERDNNIFNSAAIRPFGRSLLKKSKFVKTLIIIDIINNFNSIKNVCQTKLVRCWIGFLSPSNFNLLNLASANIILFCCEKVSYMSKRTKNTCGHYWLLLLLFFICENTVSFIHPLLVNCKNLEIYSFHHMLYN